MDLFLVKRCLLRCSARLLLAGMPFVSRELFELSEVKTVSSVPLVNPLRVDRPYSLSSSLIGDDDLLISIESLDMASSDRGASKRLFLKVSPPKGGRSVRLGEPRILRELEFEPI